VVAGVAGADLPAGVVICLGFANLLGDGFSMAVSNYSGVRAEQQQIDQVRRREMRQVVKRLWLALMRKLHVPHCCRYSCIPKAKWRKSGSSSLRRDSWAKLWIRLWV
jgi:hypothetical protein